MSRWAEALSQITKCEPADRAQYIHGTDDKSPSRCVSSANAEFWFPPSLV